MNKNKNIEDKKMNDIEKLLKEKLALQGIDKDWLDSHLEVLTDDEDEDE